MAEMEMRAAAACRAVGGVFDANGRCTSEDGLEHLPRGYEWLRRADTKTYHRVGFSEYGHFDGNKDKPDFKAIFDDLKDYTVLVVKNYTSLGNHTIFIKPKGHEDTDITQSATYKLYRNNGVSHEEAVRIIQKTRESFKGTHVLGVGELK